MKPFLSLLSFLCLMPLSVLAQEVEVEIPSEYNLIADRLSVTFKATVSESEARSVVQDKGFDIIQTQFNPVLVWAGAEQALTNAQLSSIKKHPGVLNVEQANLAAGLKKQEKKDASISAKQLLATPGMNRYQITITLRPETSEEVARSIATEVDVLSITHISKSPGEIIIRVPEETADRALLQMESSPLVKYVSFIHESDQI